jgi:hypothetical protein
VCELVGSKRLGKVKEEIDDSIQRANKKAVSNVARRSGNFFLLMEAILDPF